MAPDLPGIVQQIAHFETRIAADPGSRVFLPLADLYRRVGKLEDARRILECGLQRHPGFVTARAALGLVLSEQGEDAPARRALGAVLAVDPDNLLALKLLGREAVASQEWRTACDHLERLLRLEPENREVRENLTRARGELERQESATAPAPGPMTPRSVAVESGSGGLETPTLAQLYLHQGHPEKARLILERILAADPERQDALEVLARVKAAENAETAEKTAEKTGETRARQDADGDRPATPDGAAKPPAPARSQAAGSAQDRSEDLDRFRAWLDATSEQRDPAG